MRYLKSALLLMPLVFSGCSVNGHRLSVCEGICGKPKVLIKKQYIRQKCPKRVVLKPIPRYTMRDYRVYDETYYLINKKEFAKSQAICHRLRQKIWLLEKQ